jgi:hypothetical protein
MKIILNLITFALLVQKLQNDKHAQYLVKVFPITPKTRQGVLGFERGVLGFEWVEVWSQSKQGLLYTMALPLI